MQGRRASLVTLTYLGAERVVPNYNTMGLAKASLEASVRYLAASLGPKGIRVNGISAGPIKTLAAAGIGGFGKILKFVEEHAPLRRNVTTEDVGNAAAFLLSDLAAGITGEILYVDSGFSHVVAGIGARYFFSRARRLDLDVGAAAQARDVRLVLRRCRDGCRGARRGSAVGFLGRLVRRPCEMRSST